MHHSYYCVHVLDIFAISVRVANVVSGVRVANVVSGVGVTNVVVRSTINIILHIDSFMRHETFLFVMGNSNT